MAMLRCMKVKSSSLSIVPAAMFAQVECQGKFQMVF
ncbi:hypothetical protein ACVINW_003753 [Bradyrhizobium sp. USDA 4461]